MKFTLETPEEEGVYWMKMTSTQEPFIARVARSAAHDNELTVNIDGWVVKCWCLNETRWAGPILPPTEQTPECDHKDKLEEEDAWRYDNTMAAMAIEEKPFQP